MLDVQGSIYRTLQNIVRHPFNDSKMNRADRKVSALQPRCMKQKGRLCFVPRGLEDCGKPLIQINGYRLLWHHGSLKATPNTMIVLVIVIVIVIVIRIQIEMVVVMLHPL